MTEDQQAEIETLLTAMTLEEKIGQLVMIRGGDGTGGPKLSDSQLDDVQAGRVGSVIDILSQEGILAAQTTAAEESRLGIPLLVTLDVLHGYRTIFPIPLGEAAGFSPVLWEATARAAADEAAASHIHLTFAPMLDVSRDIRWGRIAESPGEDPWVASRFAEAKVRGFQGDMSTGTVAATAKHLGGYGAVTGGREYNSVDISARTLHEVHLPPFEAALRAGVATVMPSFNDIAGVPMTANAAILRDIVRKRWGFDGVMISDFTACAELINHGVAKGLPEAAALALKAGIDIDMVSDVYRSGLPVALESGMVDMRLVDEAVRRVLTLKAQLGLFADPFRGQGKEARPLVSPRYRDLAREAARRSIVLLQNKADALPLRGAPKHLAVLGPLADNADTMLGPWHAAGKAEEILTFLNGIKAALPGWRISHAAGSGITEKNAESFAAAWEAAREADVVLLCLGEAKWMSGEAASRARPELPQSQRLLAEAVFAWGKPVIVTLSSGRPLTIPWLFEAADAVLATWFLGSESGTALADVLTGAWNPNGRLPVSWPVDVGQVPLFYAQRPTGRPADPNNHMTSRYADITNDPLFAFGHGLSYTRFGYRSVRLSSPTLARGGAIAVEVDIANEGDEKGEETAFLFIRDPVASVARPVLELKGVGKISLAPGVTGTVRFTLSSEDVCFCDENGYPVLEAGAIEVLVGPRADRATLLKAVLKVDA